jgi:hypothetical protein
LETEGKAASEVAAAALVTNLAKLMHSELQ